MVGEQLIGKGNSYLNHNSYLNPWG